MHNIIIDNEKCINCGICVTLCSSSNVFKFRDSKVEVVSPELCWECGQCIASCPKCAISHSAFTSLGDLTPIFSDTSNINILNECLKSRRSVRFFDDKPVDRNTIEELLDITRYVPSAHNAHNVEWICIDNEETIKRLSLKTVETLKNTAKLIKNPLLRPFLKITLGSDKFEQALENTSSFELLAQKSDAGEDPIFYNAPVLLFTHTPKGSYFGNEDSFYSMYNFVLSAHQKGLGTCRIGYFDIALERNASLNEIIGITPDRQIQTTIILGYPKHKFYNIVPRKPIKTTWNPAK